MPRSSAPMLSPRLAAIQKLAEHLHARAGRLLRRLDAHDLELVAHVHHAALDPARHHRATARNREHVLNRHQERLVDRTLRRRDPAVHRFHQRADRAFADLGVTPLHRRKRRAPHDRNVVAGILVGGQKLPDLHLDELQELLVVDLIDLVHVDDHRGNAHLAAQKDVLGASAASGRRPRSPRGSRRPSAPHP